MKANPPPRKTTASVKKKSVRSGGSQANGDSLWESLALVAADADKPLERALAILGPLYRADRAWAGRYNEALTHFGGNAEWLGPGIVSHMHEVQGVSVDLIPDAHRKFLRGEPFIVPDVERMPRQQRGLQAELRRESVRSTLSFPLIHRERLIGFAGFDHVHELADWSAADIERLPALARYVGGLMDRHLQTIPAADLPATASQKSIFVTEQSGMKAISHEELLFIQADGDYTHVHLIDGRSYFERRSLRTWIAQLPRERFLRVQQSYLVNGSRIQQLDRGPRWSLTLQGWPEPIPVGRAFRHSLRLHMAF